MDARVIDGVLSSLSGMGWTVSTYPDIARNEFCVVLINPGGMGRLVRLPHAATEDAASALLLNAVAGVQGKLSDPAVRMLADAFDWSDEAVANICAAAGFAPLVAPVDKPVDNVSRETGVAP